MILRKNTKRTRRNAFTLMEMLVVVAIIVALAGIGGFFLMGQLSQTQQDVAKLQAKTTLSDAVKTYKIRHNAWPESLEQLLQPTNKGPAILENADALKTPWPNVNFQYDKSGPMNGGRLPDIWAIDPNDGTKCGNWSEQHQ